MTLRKDPEPFPDNLDADPGYSMDRLIGLGDGIFAFAMTLLAINVDIPRFADSASPTQVTQAMLNLGPEVLIFTTTFLLVATYWQVNRSVFHYIVRSDSRLTWLFIFQLLFVAFLPVASGMFDTYPGVTSVVVLYTGTLTAIGILGQLLFSHARRANLVDPNANSVLLDYFSFRGVFTFLVYLGVMLTAVIDEGIARYALFAFLALYPFLKHLFKVWYRFRHGSTAA